MGEPASTVKGWWDFVNFCNELDRAKPVEPSYAFRGQSDSSWALRPKLLRKIREIGLHENQSLRVETLALEAFKPQAHLHISPNTLMKTTTVIDWWALMQHHGAPTRLLDWTYSPYVAAYFAAIANPKKDGLVWYVDTKNVKREMTEKYGNDAELAATPEEMERQFAQDVDVLMFTTPSIKTERLAAQQGIFTVSPFILKDHTELIGECCMDDKNEKTDKKLFGYILVPQACKTEFVRELRQFNISANSLFPGLDGLARSVDELIELNADRV